MKSLTIILSLAATLACSDLMSQNYLEVFKSQDYSELDALLSSEVSVKIGKNKKVNGKQASLSAIKTKLEAFNPTSLSTKHNGSSSAKERNYLIAELSNASNEKLRLFVHLENSAKGKLICDIKLRDL